MNIYSDIYRSFQRVLMNQNRFTTALEIAEQSILKTFQDSDLFTNVYVQAFNFHRIQELTQKLNTTLVYYSILYDENQFYRFQRLHRLPMGENNVYFYPTEVLIWVIQPNGTSYCKQVDLTEFWQEEKLSLGGLIRRINEVKEGENLDLYYQDLSNLYKLLIEPIEDYLPSNPDEVITFCPQDFLYLLPFAALINAQGQYLIENHSIRIIPFLSLLERADYNQSCHQKDREILPNFIVANPSMPHLWLQAEDKPFIFPNLTQGKREMQEISALFNQVPLTNNYATKSKVIQAIQQADLIHFTTYILLSDLGGFPGAIALSPTLEDQGFLTPEAIIKLKLKARIVTISHGYRQPSYLWGNSVEKIASAFILAGAETLLLALWHHEQPATTLLLKNFYQYLPLFDHRPQVLRQAMLSTKKLYDHPLNWAYFSLLGI